jgi:hypothetical protein
MHRRKSACVFSGRPIVPLQNCGRRLETPGPKDGCGGPRSQRRPYHRKWASRLDDLKRQRMVEKSSLRDEAEMHPPQASEKTREFDLSEVSFVVNIKYLIRGGGRSRSKPVCRPSLPCYRGKNRVKFDFSPVRTFPQRQNLASLQELAAFLLDVETGAKLTVTGR